jgi:hypothetical protein
MFSGIAARQPLPDTTSSTATPSSTTTSVSTTSSVTQSVTGSLVSQSPGSTTSSSTASSTPTTGPDVPSNPSGAPIAGAAIGCLIGGLAIGFLIAFLILKKRKRRENGSNFIEYPVHADSGPKCYASAPANVLEKPLFSLDQFLLDSTPDRDLGSELKSIGELVQNHVENNYHLKPVKVNSAALDQTLVNLGLGKRGSTASSAITARALDPRTRHTALTHVISHVLFSSVDFNSRSQLSMLPAPIAAFIRSVPPIEQSTSNVEGV